MLKTMCISLWILDFFSLHNMMYTINMCAWAL
jgi:hypothetical protein